MAKEVAEEIAKKAAAKALQASIKASAKAAGSAGAKIAAKGSMGPVGWAASILDVVSLALDIWDPNGYNKMMHADFQIENAELVKETISAYAATYMEGEYLINTWFPQIHARKFKQVNGKRSVNNGSVILTRKII